MKKKIRAKYAIGILDNLITHNITCPNCASYNVVELITEDGILIGRGCGDCLWVDRDT